MERVIAEVQLHVFGRTGPVDSAAHGVTALLVPTDVPGLTRTRFDCHGQRAIGRGSIFFENGAVIHAEIGAKEGEEAFLHHARKVMAYGAAVVVMDSIERERSAGGKVDVLNAPEMARLEADKIKLLKENAKLAGGLEDIRRDYLYAKTRDAWLADCLYSTAFNTLSATGRIKWDDEK